MGPIQSIMGLLKTYSVTLSQTKHE